MGIVKISDQMHENLRVAGTALSRSINAQAEHWMRVGMLTEMHPDLDYRAICQLLIQAEGVLITMVWSAVVAYVAYKIVDLTLGLRVTEEQEREGLDISSHGETAYNR